MAKRKAARTGRGKTAARKAAGSRKSARKRAAPTRAARKAAKKARKTGARKTAARKATARRAAPRKAARARRTATKRVARKQVVKKAAPRHTARKPAARRPAPPRTAAPAAARPSVPKAIARKVPALARERRIVPDDDIVPTPPSTLDLDRSASSARSGRRELRERFDQHTETGPALTGGDVDADWESAYSVGDEAPGGDNPTPDQDIVDDIGRAMGVEYQDNEELKGDEKIAQRDRHRWELDPASSDDYEDR